MTTTYYPEMSVTEFIFRLGSGDAVPGGGGASALCGSLGAALGSMVAHLTVGRKKYIPVQAEMESVILQAEALQKEFLALIDQDAQMFLPLSRAYSMPRATSEEKDARDSVMKEALKDACQVPLQIMEMSCRALELVRTVAEKGSETAVSDAGDAAVFCKAAMQGAALNVFINTKLMKDRDLAAEYNSRADSMLHQYSPLADQIYEQVLRQLRPSEGSQIKTGVYRGAEYR